MSMSRRNFVATASLMSVGSSLCLAAGVADEGPVFLATWDFGLPACRNALESYRQNASLLDAIETGIRLTEADEEIESVGVGGAPNASGVVQLDACIMDGMTHKAGSVAGLEGYPHPISVARRVMEKTRHVMLVGAGAAEFAHEQGFTTHPLLTNRQKTKWEAWKAAQPVQANRSGRAPGCVELPILATIEAPRSHDTIALLGLGADRAVAGGCSTSGLAYKLPGRVGDSPLIGGGLYADGDVGAAGATGIGENILRFCGTFLIVELMRSGLHPTAACVAAIERIARCEQKRPQELSVNFLAIDKTGRWGAAGTDQSFQFAVVTNQSAQLHVPTIVSK